tara:strand:+ start:2575 stop:4158 length:1584 start_codon:yes stop_codon:yes gene_type:complete
MANSPDVSAYQDLTVFDEDPVAILNNILEAGRALLPNWTPEAGQIEVVLSELFANRTSELVSAINRLPSATTEVLLQLFGLTRSNGTRATATISITQSSGETIPKGSEFLFINSTNSVSYIFTLDADFASTSGTATVTAIDVGTAYNFNADSEPLSLLANTTAFTSATFSASPNGGLDAETDTEYFSRGTALLASYTTASTTPNQIKNFVGSNKTYAYRVATYNRKKYRDRDTTSLTYGTHDGHILVATAGQVNTAANASTEVVVSASNLSDLHSSLEARTPSGLAIEVMTAELAKVHVTATIGIKTGAVFATVKTAVENAIKDYLDPNKWDWEQQYVRRNEMISLIDSVTNVDYVGTLTMDAVPVIGSNNVGYYANGGGSKATTTLTIAGGTPGTYGAGDAAFYFVDSTTDPDNPTVYTFVNTASVTVAGGGGATDQAYQAISNGNNFNDATRGGKIPDGSSGFIGSAGDTGGTATASSAISGGSDDSSIFTTLNNASPTANVSSDLYLRNLGSLVTFGTITITAA